jgi:hypothetical protein
VDDLDKLKPAVWAKHTADGLTYTLYRNIPEEVGAFEAQTTVRGYLPNTAVQWAPDVAVMLLDSGWYDGHRLEKTRAGVHLSPAVAGAATSTVEDDAAVGSRVGRDASPQWEWARVTTGNGTSLAALDHTLIMLQTPGLVDLGGAEGGLPGWVSQIVGSEVGG